MRGFLIRLACALALGAALGTVQAQDRVPVPSLLQHNTTGYGGSSTIDLSKMKEKVGSSQSSGEVTNSVPNASTFKDTLGTTTK